MDEKTSNACLRTRGPCPKHFSCQNHGWNQERHANNCRAEQHLHLQSDGKLTTNFVLLGSNFKQITPIFPITNKATSLKSEFSDLAGFRIECKDSLLKIPQKSIHN